MADSQATEQTAQVEGATKESQGLEPRERFDLGKAVDRIGDALFPGRERDGDGGDIEPEDDTASDKAEQAEDDAVAKQENKVETDKKAKKEGGGDDTANAPASSTAPKSWPKEMHQHWDKMPKEAQEYWGTREKQMLDGISQYKEIASFGSTMADTIRPYEHVIRQQGIDAPRAVQYLLDAHSMLTTGSIDGRLNAYKKLGADLGLTPYMANGNAGHTQDGAIQQPQLPTEVQNYMDNLSKQVQNMRQFLEHQNNVSLQEKSEMVMKQIEAFASDPAHPYFDDVANDIVAHINAGASLPDAYEKAVWSNAAVREKRMALMREDAVKKELENARLKALPKKNAASINVRGSESQKNGAEPVGDLTDTLRQTLREIQARPT